MIRIMLAVALALGTAQPAVAGAWMREEGEGFLSFGLNAFEERESARQRLEQSIYIEYGLRPRLTLGASASYVTGKKGEGLMFLRLPILDSDRASKIAAEIGLGAESTDGITVDPYLKTGLSWGLGIQLAGRSGWANVDGAVQWSDGDAPTLYKLDATFGLSLSDRFRVMGQAFLEADENGDSLTILPSVIYSPRRWPVEIVVGIEHKTGRDERSGIRFGLWREF